MQADSSSRRPLRIRRARRACDECHRTNNKCTPSRDPWTCRSCAEFGERCTYDRPVKRRGPKVDPVTGKRMNNRTSVPPDDVLVDDWTHVPVAEPEVIEALADQYLRIVYPIFPLFHWPTFMAKIHQRSYETDRAFFATVMAMCAIVAARIKNGATSRVSRSTSSLFAAAPPSQTFKAAAVAAIPDDLSYAREFDYKRAKALLAILSVQFADIVNLHQHLGDYVTMSLASGFYDEKKWPKDLSIPEKQEWRRLFWSTYTLEIFTAISWDGIVRHRQSQTNVAYPAEVANDAAISESGCLIAEGSSSFLQGWNTTTDLYQILEHLVDQSRATRLRASMPDTAPPRNDVIQTLFAIPGPDPARVRQLVDDMYEQLRPEFKHAHAMTSDLDMDRFGFQAANLTVTAQTVYMILASADGSSVEEQCAIIGKLLDALSLIPTAYIAAISTPMLHHLASIGHLLGNVIQSPLTPWSFYQVRNALSAMANLISSLEAVLNTSSGISSKLREHVNRIDERTSRAAQTVAQAQQVFHNGHLADDTTTMEPLGNTDRTTPALISDSDSSLGRGLAQPTDDVLFHMSPGQQNQLQMELFADWPFALDQGGVHGFDWSGTGGQEGGDASLDWASVNQS